MHSASNSATIWGTMPFSEKLKEEVKRQAHFKCCLCRQEWATHVHHIIPEKGGGPDTEENAAPLCARCHNLYGGNPEMRNFIRQDRDFWYGLCDKSSPPNPQLIREIHDRVGQAATKEDLSDAIKQLTSTLEQIVGQSVSSDLKLRQMSDATAAFSFATFQSLQNTYLVRKAIARHLNLRPDELTEERCSEVTALELSKSEITDLAPLKGLTNLQSLYVSATQVSDLAPLKGLTNLQRLEITSTQVSDLAPLKGLTNLRVLCLRHTQVSKEQIAALQKALPYLYIN